MLLNHVTDKMNKNRERALNTDLFIYLLFVSQAEPLYLLTKWNTKREEKKSQTPKPRPRLNRRRISTIFSEDNMLINLTGWEIKA